MAAVGILVFLNAFFVAAEFALVSLRRSRIEQMVEERHRFGRMLLRAKDAEGAKFSDDELITETLTLFIAGPYETILSRSSPARTSRAAQVIAQPLRMRR